MSCAGESDVYAALEGLRIPYQRHAHPAVFTVAQARQHWADMPGMHCKNLFLRNKKGNRHYLVIMEHSKKADLKGLARILGEETLSLASEERLAKHLGLAPGAVSPYGLLNDGEKAVIVVLDSALGGQGDIYFHPNVNTASIGVSFPDFESFLTWRGNEVKRISL
jgi:Ala-tRNA(Pro) deacylase